MLVGPPSNMDSIRNPRLTPRSDGNGRTIQSLRGCCSTNEGKRERRRKNGNPLWPQRQTFPIRSCINVHAFSATGRASSRAELEIQISDFIVRQPFASDAGMVTSTTTRSIFEYGLSLI